MSTVTGTYENDVLEGTADAEVMQGLGGDDLLSGGAGNDSMDGGVGADTLLGGDGNDELTGGSMDDLLRGEAGSDYFWDSIGRDTLEGGAGSDSFWVGYQTPETVLVSGGEGSDRYLVSDFPREVDYRITDFVVGPGGDVIDISRLIGDRSQFDGTTMSSWFTSVHWGFAGGNPFDPQGGILRFVPSGADAVLEYDRDGADSTYAPIRLLTLVGVSVSRLTADNIEGAFAPDGTPGSGVSLTGGDDRDALQGTLYADRLSGSGGDDTLDGWAGNDTLEGGEGDDSLYPGPGDVVLDAGPGDDAILVAYATGRVLATGGPGTDTYLVKVPVLSDTFVEGSTPRADGRDFRVTDFVPGIGGDLIDVDNLLLVSSQYPLTNWSVSPPVYVGGDPFDPQIGILRLLPSGADTQLQWDRDGPEGAAYGWVTVLTLERVSADAIVAENFAGKPLTGTQLTGTAADDRLVGGFGADSIAGGEGDDTLIGSLGDDTLRGGPGNDGFSQADSLGDDLLDGEAGNDIFVDDFGSNTLIGGEGDDLFVLTRRDSDFSAAATLLSTGPGRDLIRILDGEVRAQRQPQEVLDFTPGPGGDLLDVENLLAASPLYTGGDPFEQGLLRLYQSGPDVWLQWDYDGPQGDNPWTTQLVLRGVQGTAIGADNFVGRLVVGTVGPDELQGGFGIDTLVGLGGDDTLDGGLSGDSMEGGLGNDIYYTDSRRDLVVEIGGEGVDTVNAGLDWTLSANVENLVLAGAGNTRATGNLLPNALTGNAGANVLNGGKGADTMAGGAGGDTYYVDSRGDRVVEAKTIAIDAPTAQSGDADTQGSGAGIDKVVAQISYTLTANVENLQLAGSANLSGAGNELGNILTGNGGANRLDGLAGSDVVDGGGGNDTVIGAAGNDTLGGGGGADLLLGGPGNDRLLGGAGNDRFVFDAAPGSGNVDSLPDFVPGTDTLALDRDVFPALAGATTVSAEQFLSGAGVNAATSPAQRILYDTASGSLYYDADGSGGEAAIRIAVLGGSTRPPLGPTDLLIVE